MACGSNDGRRRLVVKEPRSRFGGRGPICRDMGGWRTGFWRFWNACVLSPKIFSLLFFLFHSEADIHRSPLSIDKEVPVPLLFQKQSKETYNHMLIVVLGFLAFRQLNKALLMHAHYVRVRVRCSANDDVWVRLGGTEQPPTSLLPKTRTTHPKTPNPHPHQQTDRHAAQSKVRRRPGRVRLAAAFVGQLCGRLCPGRAAAARGYVHMHITCMHDGNGEIHRMGGKSTDRYVQHNTTGPLLGPSGTATGGFLPTARGRTQLPPLPHAAPAAGEGPATPPVLLPRYVADACSSTTGDRLVV